MGRTDTKAAVAGNAMTPKVHFLQGIFVKWVSPASAATGKLHAGDRLLAVNDVPLCQHRNRTNDDALDTRTSRDTTTSYISRDSSINRDARASEHPNWIAAHQLAVELIRDASPGDCIKFLVQRLATQDNSQVITLQISFCNFLLDLQCKFNL